MLDCGPAFKNSDVDEVGPTISVALKGGGLTGKGLVWNLVLDVDGVVDVVTPIVGCKVGSCEHSSHHVS